MTTVSSESDDARLLAWESPVASVRRELSVANEDAETMLESVDVLIAEETDDTVASEDELSTVERTGRDSEGAIRLDDLFLALTWGGQSVSTRTRSMMDLRCGFVGSS